MRIRSQLLTLALLALCAPAQAQTTISASSADWILDGTQPTGTFGSRVGPAGDVNGDGFDDVLVGDSAYDGAFNNGGRIELYLGSAAGLSQAPAWSLEGGAEFALLEDFSRAGDVNGDGFGDFVVFERSDGLRRLFLGSATGPTPSAWQHQGGFLVGTGDINGDGYNDLALNHFLPADDILEVFYGSAAGLELVAATTLTPSGFGLYDGTVQDFDADGYADLAYVWKFCTKNCAPTVSYISLHLGSSNGLKKKARHTVSFGREEVQLVLDGAGDVDGDGFADLPVMVLGGFRGNNQSVELLLFHGNASGMSSQPDIRLQAESFIYYPHLVGMRDVNGDGLSDVMIAESYDEPVSLQLLAGEPGGLPSTPSTIIVGESNPEPEFTSLWAPAGDVNGDGIGDLITGAARFWVDGSPVGRVYVFHGRATF